MKTTKKQTAGKTANELNPMSMSEQDMDFAREEVQKVWANNRPVFDRAVKVVKQLGLGGLWRGSDASILIVANEIALRESYAEGYCMAKEAN